MKKLVMNRLGKTVELIVKLENNLHDEGKDDQKVKIRDQLETRGLEAARDHEMLELRHSPRYRRFQKENRTFTYPSRMP